MSYTDSLLECPELQGPLDDLWQNPSQWGGAEDAAPFAEFITSPANRRAIVDSVSPGNGKVHTVTMKGYQRLDEDDVTCETVPNCTGTGKPTQFYQTYTVDTSCGWSSSFDIQVDEFQRVCEADSAEIMKRLLLAMDVLDRKVATLIANQSAVLLGAWSGDIAAGTGAGQVQSDTYHILPFTDAAMSQPSGSALMMLRNGLDISGFPPDTYLFGGTTMRLYMQTVMAGCCNQYGVNMFDVMQQYGYAYGFDKRLQAALGSGNDFVAIAPGALQLLTFTLFDRAFTNEDLLGKDVGYAFGRVRSPRFGTWYDVVRSQNCGTINYTVSFIGQMISLPSDIYGAWDHLHGVNFAAQATCNAGT